MTIENIYEHQYIGSKICLASDLGIHGNLFGGNMLSLIDEASAIFACFLIQDKSVVTKKFGDTVFHAPVKAGDIIYVYGKLIKCGTTSVTLGIEVKKHNPKNGKEKVVCTNEIIFVRIDDDGESMPIADRVRSLYEK